jgi:hypothetical protein
LVNSALARGAHEFIDAEYAAAATAMSTATSVTFPLVR